MHDNRGQANIQLNPAAKGHVDEENDFHYLQERSSYIKFVKNFGFLAILVAAAHVALTVIIWQRDHRSAALAHLVFAVLFLVSALIAVVWAFLQQNHDPAAGQHLHPKGDVHDNNLSKVVFINGLLLAGLAFYLFVNLHVQFNSPVHYLEAHEAPKSQVEQTIGMLVACSVFTVLHFCYSLLIARASFRTLRNNTEAMSYVLYLGVTLLFVFALGLVVSVQKVGYELDDKYSAMQTNFPIWILKGLWIVGVALAVTAILGLLVNFRRWRIGYFALAFILLISLVLLVHLVGYSYRQRKVVAKYYSDNRGYYERLYDTHRSEIEAFGCPAKYVDISNSVSYDVWEDPNDHTRKKLNPDCAGLLGDMYSDYYVDIANWGLLALLAAAMISIACYYFWYVSWFNATTHHKREYFWFGLFGAIVVAYIFVWVYWNPQFFDQRTVAVTPATAPK